MRAKRMSNDRTGTTRAVRSSNAKMERMGREWGYSHGKNATSVGNLAHDRACALAVKETTGRYPNWTREQFIELGLFTQWELEQTKK